LTQGDIHDIAVVLPDKGGAELQVTPVHGSAERDELSIPSQAGNVKLELVRP
jgi:hypothetical protein